MAQQNSGVTDNVRDGLAKNPAVERLLGEAETYVRNRAQGLVDSLGDRISDTAERLDSFAADGGRVAKGTDSSVLKAGAKAVGRGVRDRVAGLFAGGGGGGDNTKATVITESIEVGVPLSVAYNQWTQFTEFGGFTKGVQSVEQVDDTTTNWKAKIGLSTRSWNATLTEQVPDQKIAWTSDGDKGSVNGIVTFHELAPTLTKVLLELDYHPKGFFEKTGNLWRAQGRRARLDLKHFRRFVMMRGEETGAWRGEIHDSQVTRAPGEGTQQRQRRGRPSGESARKSRSARRTTSARRTEQRT